MQRNDATCETTHGVKFLTFVSFATLFFLVFSWWYQVLDSVFGVLLSLYMLYPQIISHCIDHDIMDFDSETLFRSSVCDVMLWILCFDLG